ncbi:Glycosyltransferase [Rhynchospora pubera]|uniref:Glycosyltransferase n=1 Tax=Rhynchospora pubera TaxID=906938 RepID=A0AAV8GP72_9POAL|nr:Glycosyltransferase [Rhynchospora pubera]
MTKQTEHPTMEKDTVVLYPGVGFGHLVPMVELAKLFIRDGFSVTILIIDKSENTGSELSRISSANPSIYFHILPPVPIPSDAPLIDIMLTAPRLQNSNLLSYLGTLSSLRAIILDFFCIDVLDVANELHIPSYIFYTASAYVLSICLYFPFFHSTTTASLKDMEEVPLQFPGASPVVAFDMPEPMLDRDKPIYKKFLYTFKKLQNAGGILVNTFEWFESKEVRVIKDGLCVPDGSTPPIYCIGPVTTKGSCKEGQERHDCLTWLDKQPRQSVLFLCFGSMGTFSFEQLKEMAAGLENSGHRFLWVVRDPKNMFEEPNLDQFLPKGFLDRTKDRGLVVKSWAPQWEVLQHDAVGGFVTHCGWNSILEAVTAGVPMICWPLYAEQRLSRRYLVEELKVALSIEGYEKGLVNADEVEKKVRWLMESNEGKELRNWMAVVKDKAMEALKEGGPSWQAFKVLVSSLKESGTKEKVEVM